PRSALSWGILRARFTLVFVEVPSSVWHAERFLCAYTGPMSGVVPPISPKWAHGASDTSRLLLQRVAAGDKEAVHSLYREYGPRVAALVRKRVGEPQLAEELVQDIFVAAWQSAQGYRSDLGDPELWLLGIARHKLQDHWRRLRRLAERVRLPSTD